MQPAQAPLSCSTAGETCPHRRALFRPARGSPFLLETQLPAKPSAFFRELKMCFPPHQARFYSNQHQPFRKIFAFLRLFSDNKAVLSSLELVFLFYLVNIFKHYYCYNKC